MIEFDETEQLESDFTDLTLHWIQEIYGPRVKDMLLLPGPVEVLPYDNRLPTGSEGIHR